MSFKGPRGPLKDPGALSKDPGVLLKDPGVGGPFEETRLASGRCSLFLFCFPLVLVAPAAQIPWLGVLGRGGSLPAQREAEKTHFFWGGVRCHKHATENPRVHGPTRLEWVCRVRRGGVAVRQSGNCELKTTQ